VAVHTLTQPGTLFGPVVEIQAGAYQLTLMTKTHGVGFSLQTLTKGKWADVPTPPLVPGPDTIRVDLPAGLIRLDAVGRWSADVFAILTPA